MSGPSSAPTSLCTLRDVGFAYRGGVDALRGVTLDVARGELIVLSGDNGSGKSTLLALMAGQLLATAGDVRWLGTSALDRTLVSFVAQDPELDPEMTGSELLSLLAVLHGVATRVRQARIETLCGELGATPLLPRRIQQLSGGQKRRVHLIAGLISDAPLLLLDEPTTHLDHSAQQALWRHLQQAVAQRRTVVVAEHDAGAHQHATRTVELRAGAIVRDSAVRP